MLHPILVSVIIPFYKNRTWLEEALKSVLSQTLTDFEVIVVNDGSTENIDDLVKQFAPKVRFITTVNRGAAIARNIGIKEALGKYLAFLDSDDLWLPEKLLKQVAFMEKHHFEWSHTDYFRFNELTGEEKYVRCNIFGHMFPKALVWNPIATPCVIISRNIVLENEFGFQENKAVGEDNYFWEQMGKHYPLGYLAEGLTRVRIHGSNTAYNAYLQLKGRGDLVENVKANKHTFENKGVYYYLLTTLYFCRYSFRLFSPLFPTNKFGRDKSQLFFKLLYGIVYINFRIIRRLL